jgi:hypothetical protein
LVQTEQQHFFSALKRWRPTYELFNLPHASHLLLQLGSSHQQVPIGYIKYTIGVEEEEEHSATFQSRAPVKGPY